MIRKWFLLLLAVALAAAAGKPHKRDAEVDMADSVWISTTGDLNAAASYSPSGVPIAAGNVAFTGASNRDVSTNLTAFSALDMGRIWTMPDYEGDIGAAGNPLTTASPKFIIQGSGSVWYAQEGLATGVNHVVVDSQNQQDAFTLVSTVSGNFQLAILNGGVDILDNAGAIHRMYVAAKSNNQSPTVNIGTGMVVNLYVQRTGYVNTKTAILGTTILDGGILESDASSGDAWSANVFIAGGTFKFNSAGGATLISVSSGTLDMSGDPRAKTISTLILFPGANFITHNNIFVTNMVDLRGSVPVLP